MEAHIKSESEDCDDFKMLIRILIPNFPSHDAINVPENILTEVIKGHRRDGGMCSLIP